MKLYAHDVGNQCIHAYTEVVCCSVVDYRPDFTRINSRDGVTDGPIFRLEAGMDRAGMCDL